MSDDLRTKIAAVLYEDGQRPMDTAMRLADAVIRELSSAIRVPFHSANSEGVGGSSSFTFCPDCAERNEASDV